jgi:hypothetical protein
MARPRGAICLLGPRLIAMAVNRFLPLPFFLGFPLCIGHASQVVARMQKFAIRAKDIALVDRGVSLNGRDDAAYLLFRDDLPGYDWEPLNDEFGEVSLIKKAAPQSRTSPG